MSGRKLLASLAVLGFVAWLSGQGAPPPARVFTAGPGEGAFLLRARVAEVLSGSRYALDLAGRRSLVELDGAVAPRPDQAYGREAAAFARERILGKAVNLSVSRIEGDHAVARLELDTGENLGLELVRAGLAWAAPGCPDPLCQGAQREAREARAGLWADRDPVPPWAGSGPQGSPAAAFRPETGQLPGLLVVAALAFLAWYLFQVSRRVGRRLADNASPPAEALPRPERPVTRLVKAWGRRKFGRDTPPKEDS